MSGTVLTFISVASGRSAPKQRKGGREAAGADAAAFAIDVEDSRFSSVFTGGLMQSIAPARLPRTCV
jgi:hypothetical protein